MVTIEHITTAEELLQTPGLGRCELVRGELIMMSPAGSEHGSLVVNITVALANYVKLKALGRVFGAETGFVIRRDPDTVRAPDVAFVCAERVAAGVPKGFFDGPPDLAVEVTSPSDRPGEVLAKVHDWLHAGCRAVWVIDTDRRCVCVYRSRTEVVVLGMSDQLSGGDVVPGFSVPVAEVFAA
jgi:Uma2 family endonuclease